MAQNITIAQAFAQWNADNGMGSPKDIFGDDRVALSESWNNYTDSLCNGGELTALQYHYCPAWDAEMPEGSVGGECEFLLEAMGARFSAKKVDQRKDGLMQESATHWEVTITRRGQSMHVNYSMGAAHAGVPQDADVLNCLLLDTDGVKELFETWAGNLGYDTDSRQAEKIYNACKETAYGLARLFKPSELADLREVLQDY